MPFFVLFHYGVVCSVEQTTWIVFPLFFTVRNCSQWMSYRERSSSWILWFISTLKNIMFSLNLIDWFLFSFASCIHTYISIDIRKSALLNLYSSKKFGGPSVHGDRIGWGLFLQRDQSIWDPLCGIICVWDQMCHSLYINPKEYQV